MPVDLRAMATDPSFADGSAGSGVAEGCFDVTLVQPGAAGHHLECFPARLDELGTWIATANIPTGTFEVTMKGRDQVGNWGEPREPVVIVVVAVG